MWFVNFVKELDTFEYIDFVWFGLLCICVGVWIGMVLGAIIKSRDSGL